LLEKYGKSNLTRINTCGSSDLENFTEIDAPASDMLLLILLLQIEKKKKKGKAG
jgi:hypothetical protein